MGARSNYDGRPPAVANHLDALVVAGHTPAEAGVVDRLDAADDETVIVVGRHRESDVLAEASGWPLPRVGDLLVCRRRAATATHDDDQLQRNRRIPVVFVADGVARLAARREPWADPLVRNVD